jgi:hypothetical protein
LICSTDTVLERIANESRSAFGKLTDPDLYIQIEAAGGFRFPPLPKPLLSIDTSAVEAEHAARLIEEALARVA